MLSVLSEDFGKISIAAKAAKSYKRDLLNGSQVFCYADYILNQGKSVYTVHSCTPIENFFGLTNDLDRYGSASKLVDFVSFIATENENAKDILRLILNSLHALSNTNKPIILILDVFYLKIIDVLGFVPELNCCSACDVDEDLCYFSIDYGGLLCKSCSSNIPDAKPIHNDVATAMKYITNSPIEKMFSFSAGDVVLNQIYSIVKEFISYHLDYTKF